MRIVLIILATAGVLVAGFVAIGYFAPREFEGKLVKVFPCNENKLWLVMNDIEGIPARRREITKVEMLGTTAQGLPRWKEYTDMDGYIMFEMTERIPQRRMSVRMTESSFGMTGEWSYELAADETACTLTITEKSAIDNTWIRAIMTLTGRNSNLREEFRTLQAAAERI